MDYTSREEMAIWSIHFVHGTDTHLFNTYILSGCGNYEWWNTMRTNQSNIFRKTKYFVIRLRKLYVTMGSLYQNTYSTFLLLWYHNGFDRDRFLPMEYPRSYNFFVHVRFLELYNNRGICLEFYLIYIHLQTITLWPYAYHWVVISTIHDAKHS